MYLSIFPQSFVLYTWVDFFSFSFLSASLHYLLSQVNKLHKLSIFKNCSSLFNFNFTLQFGPWNLFRGTNNVVQDCKQVPLHNMARITLRRYFTAATHHRIHSQEWKFKDYTNPESLVGSDMGTNTLRSRLWQKVFMYHCRLWLRQSSLRRRWCQTSGNISRVHLERSWWAGLLRREFGWR